MAPDWEWCAVLNDRGIVLGRIRRRQLSERPDAPAGETMELGPATYRPSLPVAELLQKMKETRVDAAFVTNSDGRWLGTVRRRELEAAANADW